MKTLLKVGPKRGGVRVYEDEDRQLVRATWREHGRVRRKSWPLTPAGRLEAKAWARGFAEVRDTPAPSRSPTVRELWALYAEAEYPHLRPRTQTLYAARWRLFERFALHDTIAATVGPLTLGQFAAELRRQDYAPNQVGEHVKMAKLVFIWARANGVLPETKVPDYRFKLAKEESKQEPAEYRHEDFERLVATLSPQSAVQWRASAVLMFLGHQGVRENAALHLRWTDIREGSIHWPKSFDKTGREDFVQPIRDGALAALLTALDWRRREGYEGQWVFPSARRRRRAKDHPYTAQALARALRVAEERAGVPHLDLRGAHGLRKMVVGDVATEMGDAYLALQFVGDRDPRLIPTYLKQRLDRLKEVAERMDRNPKPAPERLPTSGDATAPSVTTDGAATCTEPPVGLEPTTARRKNRPNRHGSSISPLSAETSVGASTPEKARFQPETGSRTAPGFPRARP